MKRVRVKVCGLRDPAVAAEIAKCGADAIGLVFADSPRWVSVEQARAVTDVLPAFVSAVGVFVDASADAMNRAADKARLHYLQLHGDEPAEIVEQLDRPVIKAFRVKDASWVGQVHGWLARVPTPSRVAAILLDTFKPGAHGGTGERFNWEVVADARSAGVLAGMPPIILSGGLDEKNVVSGIELVQPWAVDVSSGVEKSPGVKDAKKASRFIATVIHDVSGLRGGFWG